MPVVGDIFESRYQITSHLGEGGFAVVFDAIDRETGEAVALKILRKDPYGGYESATKRRFEREVNLLFQLRSPYTVRLHDAGTAASGELFMVFERVPGRDLSEYLAAVQRLPPHLVNTILRQLLMALAEAHEKGLIHRDLKPENVRIYETEEHPLTVKLLDFGIARSTDDSHPAVTRTGELIGTPRYMSPEQLLEKPLTAASDIYSLGMMTLELVVGRDHLPSNRFGDQLDRLVSGYVFSVPEAERVGPELIALILRMTARDPDRRWPNAGAVLESLDAADVSYGGPTDVAPPSRRTNQLLAGAAAVLVIGSGAALLVGDEDEGAEEARPPPTIPQAIVQTEQQPPPTPPTSEPPTKVVTNPPADGSPGCGQPARRSNVCNRDYCLHLPQDYSADTAHPLLVVYRPLLENTREFLARFDALSNSESVIVMAPQGDDLKPWRNGDGQQVKQLVEFVKEDHCVDETRVFAFGTQDGARGASILDCEDVTTAVALHAYLYQAGGSAVFKCANPMPKPMIWFAPLQSTRWPTHGRGHCFSPDDHMLSLAETVGVWAERNGCEPAPVTAQRCVALACDDVPTEFCTVAGGAASECQDEPAATDFDEVLDRMWAFFDKVAPPKTTD